MDSTSAPSGSPDFQQDLLALREDPQVKRLALSWARTTDLAEDILQDAYCGIVALKHPERIGNLRPYFIRVLKNQAAKLYAASRETPYEVPELALDPRHPDPAICGPVRARPVDDMVCDSFRDQTWLRRLAEMRDCLLTAVPARSDDARRYRAVICAAAEQVLRDGINGEPSDADGNDALQRAYPEYFDQPGAATNTLHQRLRRAREDVKALLRAVVHRDELI